MERRDSTASTSSGRSSTGFEREVGEESSPSGGAEFAASPELGAGPRGARGSASAGGIAPVPQVFDAPDIGVAAAAAAGGASASAPGAGGRPLTLALSRGGGGGGSTSIQQPVRPAASGARKAQGLSARDYDALVLKEALPPEPRGRTRKTPVPFEPGGNPNMLSPEAVSSSSRPLLRRNAAGSQPPTPREQAQAKQAQVSQKRPLQPVLRRTQSLPSPVAAPAVQWTAKQYDEFTTKQLQPTPGRSRARHRKVPETFEPGGNPNMLSPEAMAVRRGSRAAAPAPVQRRPSAPTASAAVKRVDSPKLLGNTKKDWEKYEAEKIAKEAAEAGGRGGRRARGQPEPEAAPARSNRAVPVASRQPQPQQQQQQQQRRPPPPPRQMAPPAAHTSPRPTVPSWNGIPTPAPQRMPEEPPQGTTPMKPPAMSRAAAAPTPLPLPKNKSFTSKDYDALVELDLKKQHLIRLKESKPAAPRVTGNLMACELLSPRPRASPAMYQPGGNPNVLSPEFKTSEAAAEEAGAAAKSAAPKKPAPPPEPKPSPEKVEIGANWTSKDWERYETEKILKEAAQAGGRGGRRSRSKERPADAASNPAAASAKPAANKPAAAKAKPGVTPAAAQKKPSPEKAEIGANWTSKDWEKYETEMILREASDARGRGGRRSRSKERPASESAATNPPAAVAFAPAAAVQSRPLASEGARVAAAEAASAAVETVAATVDSPVLRGNSTKDWERYEAEKIAKQVAALGGRRSRQKAAAGTSEDSSSRSVPAMPTKRKSSDKMPPSSSAQAEPKRPVMSGAAMAAAAARRNEELAAASRGCVSIQAQAHGQTPQAGSRKPEKWTNATYDQIVMSKLLQTNTRRTRKTPAHFEPGGSPNVLSPELASPEFWSRDPVPVSEKMSPIRPCPSDHQMKQAKPAQSEAKPTKPAAAHEKNAAPAERRPSPEKVEIEANWSSKDWEKYETEKILKEAAQAGGRGGRRSRSREHADSQGGASSSEAAASESFDQPKVWVEKMKTAAAARASADPAVQRDPSLKRKYDALSGTTPAAGAQIRSPERERQLMSGAAAAAQAHRRRSAGASSEATLSLVAAADATPMEGRGKKAAPSADAKKPSPEKVEIGANWSSKDWERYETEKILKEAAQAGGRGGRRSRSKECPASADASGSKLPQEASAASASVQFAPEPSQFADAADFSGDSFVDFSADDRPTDDAEASGGASGGSARASRTPGHLTGSRVEPTPAPHSAATPHTGIGGQTPASAQTAQQRRRPPSAQTAQKSAPKRPRASSAPQVDSPVLRGNSTKDWDKYESEKIAKEAAALGGRRSKQRTGDGKGESSSCFEVPKISQEQQISMQKQQRAAPIVANVMAGSGMPVTLRSAEDQLKARYQADGMPPLNRTAEEYGIAPGSVRGAADPRRSSVVGGSAAKAKETPASSRGNGKFQTPAARPSTASKHTPAVRPAQATQHVVVPRKRAATPAATQEARSAAVLEGEVDAPDQPDAAVVEWGLGALRQQMSAPVPAELVGRQTQFTKLLTLLQRPIVSNENTAILLSGCRGTGKTATLEFAMNELNRKHPTAKPSHVYLNGLLHATDTSAVLEIARQLYANGATNTAPAEASQSEEGISSADAVADEDEGPDGDEPRTFAAAMAQLKLALLPEQNTTPRTIVLVLDEFDRFAQRTRQMLLYNLFQFLHSSSTKIVIVGITACLDALEQLEKRVKSRFNPTVVSFPYLEHEGLKNLMRNACRMPQDSDSGDAETDEKRRNYAVDFNNRLDEVMADYAFTSRFNHAADVSRDCRHFAALARCSLVTIRPATPFYEPVSFFGTSIVQCVPSVACRPSPRELTLMELTRLQMIIVVAMHRLQKKRVPASNFQMMYAEYEDLVGAKRGIATASTAEADREPRRVVLAAFEQILEMDLFRPSEGEGSSKGGQQRTLFRMEFQMMQLLLSERQVEWLIDNHPRSFDALKTWHQRLVS